MEVERSQFAVKLLPSLTDFAFLLPGVFLFSRMQGVKTLLSDCDTGWHIRTGQWILANHRVPWHDFYSFSKPGAVWYAWEWLSDVLFAVLNRVGGLALVVVLGLLLITAIFTLLFRRVGKRANAVVAILVTAVAVAGSSIHWLARPHLFTLLFVLLFHAALDEVRDGRRRLWGVPYLALLPAATILWTNLHGGFFVGIVMIGAYGAGELVRGALAPGAGELRAAWGQARPYLLSALGCLAASLINPYTYHLHAHVISYLRDPYQAAHIIEFLSLSFQNPIAIFFEIMLAGAAAAALWNARRGRWAEPVYLLVWAHAALLAVRNVPVFLIVAAPPVGAAVDAWLARLPELDVAGWLRAAAARFNRVALETTATDRIPRWHLVSGLAAALFVVLLYAPHPPKRLRAEFDPDTYPAGAVEMLRRDGAARIFANDEWGDYLIYRLYPGNRVFVDGRSDFYGSSFEQKYLDVMNVKYGWEDTLDRFGVNTILLPPSAALTGALKESRSWSVVYDDGVAVVFRPAAGAAGSRTNSVTATGDGEGRDRKVTKTEARDQAITETKPRT